MRGVPRALSGTFVKHCNEIWKQILILLGAIDILFWKQNVCFLEAMLVEINMALEADTVSFVSKLSTTSFLLQIKYR
jgi:hypothetical protein